MSQSFHIFHCFLLVLDSKIFFPPAKCVIAAFILLISTHSIWVLFYSFIEISRTFFVVIFHSFFHRDNDYSHLSECILARKIPWTVEPGRSMGSQRVRHNWATSLSLFWVYRLEFLNLNLIFLILILCPLSWFFFLLILLFFKNRWVFLGVFFPPNFQVIRTVCPVFEWKIRLIIRHLLCVFPAGMQVSFPNSSLPWISIIADSITVCVKFIKCKC